ncbi:MAG: leucine-rich repeat domain-containing protein [Eubacteriales bacterium]
MKDFKLNITIIVLIMLFMFFISFYILISCEEPAESETLSTDEYETLEVINDETAEKMELFQYEKRGDGYYKTGYTGREKKIILPAEYNSLPVTGLGEKAFYGNSSVEYIELSESISEIGKACFYGSGLKTIILNDKLKTISSGSFASTSISEINIPESVTSIGAYSFGGCGSLKSINLSENILNISDGTFSFCENLISINIDQSNAKYCSEDGVLFDKEKTILSAYPCGKKETIYEIPETVKLIANSAFKGNMNLTEIILNNKIEKIKDSAFRECRSLLQIIIPNSVTEIGLDVFYGCESLTDVYIPDSVIRIKCRFYNSNNVTVHCVPQSAAYEYLSKIINQNIITDY